MKLPLLFLATFVTTSALARKAFRNGKIVPTVKNGGLSAPTVENGGLPKKMFAQVTEPKPATPVLRAATATASATPTKPQAAQAAPGDSLFTRMKKGMKEGISNAGKDISETMTTMKKGVKEGLSSMEKGAKEAASSMKKGISETFKAGKAFIEGPAEVKKMKEVRTYFENQRNKAQTMYDAMFPGESLDQPLQRTVSNYGLTEEKMAEIPYYILDAAKKAKSRALALQDALINQAREQANSGPKLQMVAERIGKEADAVAKLCDEIFGPDKSWPCGNRKQVQRQWAGVPPEPIDVKWANYHIDKAHSFLTQFQEKLMAYAVDLEMPPANDDVSE